MSIKTDAVVIRDEITTGANTAVRVGTNLVAIADDLVAKQAAISANTSKISYTDAAAVALNTAKVSNIAHPLVEKAVPINAVFTDTVYDDTTIQAEVDLNTAKNSYPSVDSIKLAGIEAGATADQDLSGKQDVLVSGTNIKTVNSISILGAGDIPITAGSIEGTGVLSTGEGVGRVLQADGDNTCSWVTLAGGGDALTANPLSQFAPTTKAQLDGVISDGDVKYVGDAPTAHTHVEADITDLGTYSTDIHANIIALNAVTGTNTGDQVLTGLDYEPTKGVDDNYVTDAEKVVIGNTSGTNTGDQVIPVTGVDFDPVGTDNSDNNAVNTLYSGLATSKQDTLVSATNIKTINGTTILGSGDLVVDGGATGSDVAYDVITWDANTDVPTKNVISDLYENKTFKVDTDGALVPIVPIYWQGTQAEFTTKFGATAPPNYFTVVPDANPPAIEGTDIASTGEVGGTKYLREDGDGTSSWQPIVGGGDVTKVGTAFENQVAIWKTDGSIEGLGGLTFDDVTTNALNVGLGADNQGTIKIGGNAMLSSNDANVSSLFNGSLIKTGTDLAFTGNITSAGTINGATITSGTLNGSVTGTNTGDNAVNTLYSGLVSYVDILKEDLAVSSASFDIDWSKNTHYYELTGITTFLTQSNLPPAGQSKTITIHITGDFALTLPTAWDNINGAYAGATLNTIVVEYVAISTTPFYRVEIITTPV